MLSFFRKTLGTKVAGALLALIIAAFVVTGVYTHEMGGSGGAERGSGDTIAKVGGVAIHASQAEQRVRRAVQAQNSQQPGLDVAAFVANGGLDQTISQLIDATAVEVFGRKQGIVAGRKLIDGEIASVQSFKGPTGKFDEQLFRQVLAQQRITEPELRGELAGDVIRRQLLLPIAGAARVPVKLATPYASLLLEDRQGMIGVVPSEALAGGTPPSDAELAAWHKAHIADYTLGERRVLRYALVGRDRVAAGAVPSEAEIAAFYKANAPSYAASERRTLSQVVLRDRAAAQALVDKVKAGERFAKAAQEAGFSASDTALGPKTQTELASLASPEVAAAAYAAPEGGISAPAKSPFGWHVVHVDAISRTPGKSLDQARPEIAASIAKQKQDAALAALVNGIEDELSDGASFDEVVKKHGLEVVTTPPVLQTGAAPDQADWKAPPELGLLLKPAFATSADEKPTVETLGAGERYAVLGVAKVVAPTPQPLDAVRERVAHDFGADRAAKRAKALAEAIVAKVNGGMGVAQAFASAGVRLPPPQKAGGKRLQIAQAQGQVPPPLALLFSMARGKAQMLAAPNNAGWFVVKLDSITPGDATQAPQLVEATRGQFAQVIGEEYMQQFAAAARGALGVKRDESAIAALRARLTGAAPAAADQ